MGKHFGSSRHFANQLYTFHIIIWTLFGSSGHFPNHPDGQNTFHIRQIIRILCRSSGHFSYHPDTFRIIQTLCRSSRDFADQPQIFYIIWFLLRPSGSFLGDIPDTPRTRKKKTFQICKKLLSRWWGFCDSAHDHPLTWSQQADLALVASWM